MKQELIFMGAPASGKGTQTIKLGKETSLPHVDTGSLIRNAIKNETEYGKIAKNYVEQGKLVPAELVADIIKDRLFQVDCINGFMLDGYPRSIEQAEKLDEILAELNKGEDIKPKVIYFDVDKNILLERIINRRSCPRCGAIYNTKFAPSKVDGICDNDNEVLIQRKDDTEQIAKTRFETYYNETEPLIEFYEKRGILRKVDATGSVDVIYARLLDAIK